MPIMPTIRAARPGEWGNAAVYATHEPRSSRDPEPAPNPYVDTPFPHDLWMCGQPDEVVYCSDIEVYAPRVILIHKHRFSTREWL